MKKKIISLGSILILISLLTTICLASGSEPVDLTNHNSILEEEYRKVGINLEEELQKENLYQKDGKYFIKFKEPSLKKWVLKRLKDTDSLDIKEVSLKNALLLDAISVPNANIKTLDNFKMFLNVTYINLEGNKVIKDYSDLKYFKKLNDLNLQNNDLSNIKFLELINPKLEYLSLGNNQIKNIKPIKYLINLKRLILYDNQIIDLSYLSSLERLEELWLMNNQLKTLKGLENLTELAILYIEINPLTVEGLEPIKKLNLYELTIDRKVFDGIVFTKYPKFLWNIESLKFIEEGENE